MIIYQSLQSILGCFIGHCFGFFIAKSRLFHFTYIIINSSLIIVSFSFHQGVIFFFKKGYDRINQ